MSYFGQNSAFHKESHGERFNPHQLPLPGIQAAARQVEARDERRVQDLMDDLRDKLSRIRRHTPMTHSSLLSAVRDAESLLDDLERELR